MVLVVYLAHHGIFHSVLVDVLFFFQVSFYGEVLSSQI